MINGAYEDDSVPPPPTVRVELNGVHEDNLRPSLPTVRVELDGVYVDDSRPQGDFPPKLIAVGQCEEQSEEPVISVPPPPPTQTPLMSLMPMQTSLF